MENNGWIKKTVELEVRKGTGTWWQLQIGGKKFIMMEVKEFKERKDEVAEVFK